MTLSQDRRRSFVAAIVIALGSANAGAQQVGAVAATNGQIDLGYSYSDLSLDVQPGFLTPQLTFNSLDIGGQLNFPIYSFLGGSVRAFAGSQRTDVDYPTNPWLGVGGVSFSCAQEGWGGGASLFARDPELGRIRGNWSAARVPVGCDYETEYSATRTQYGLDVEAYLDRWTIAALVTRSSLEYGEGVRLGFNSYGGGISYYPSVDWRIGGGYRYLPDSKFDTYVIDVEYQPGWLGSRWSAKMGYARGDNDYSRTNAYTLVISYYFGPTADLLKRDRYLR